MCDFWFVKIKKTGGTGLAILHYRSQWWSVHRRMPIAKRRCVKAMYRASQTVLWIMAHCCKQWIYTYETLKEIHKQLCSQEVPLSHQIWNYCYKYFGHCTIHIINPPVCGWLYMVSHTKCDELFAFGTQRPTQRGSHFAVDVFKIIFHGWNICILIQITLIVAAWAVYVKSSLVRIMTLAPNKRQVIIGACQQIRQSIKINWLFDILTYVRHLQTMR